MDSDVERRGFWAVVASMTKIERHSDQDSATLQQLWRSQIAATREPAAIDLTCAGRRIAARVHAWCTVKSL